MTLLKNLLYLLLLLSFPLLGSAQNDKPKPHWQHLDLKEDAVFGISTDKAYQLLKNKEPIPVIVAVIDGGIDEKHEDLQDVMWQNKKEIQGNNIDDDNNGYTDDIYGWNFIGSSIGNVHYDNLEVTRLIRKYKPKYGSVLNSTPLDEKERKEFETYKKLITVYMDKLQRAQMGQTNYTMLKKYIDQIVEKIGKNEPALSDFEKYETKDEGEQKALKIIKSELKDEPSFSKFYKNIKEGVDYFNAQVNYHLNLEFNSRDTVGDNYANSSERYYGNNDIAGPDAKHGTHVAGIIGAVRDNSI